MDTRIVSFDEPLLQAEKDETMEPLVLPVTKVDDDAAAGVTFPKTTYAVAITQYPQSR